MEGILYPISLLVIAVIAFSFYRTNNTTIAFLLILSGAYIIYSHETGNTITEYKNEIVKSADEAAGY